MLRKILYGIATSKFSRKSSLIIGRPFNLTLSVTGRCNSKCKTCNIWQKEVKDLSLEQWEKILESIGKGAVWVTISGGEPFIRDDFAELMKLVAIKKPKIITIATNGILAEKILSDVSMIRQFFKGDMIVNISVDGVGIKHDYMRGVKCHSQVEKTIEGLKQIKEVHVGLHTVFSQHNVDNADEIIDYVKGLKPHSYISQIVETRVELGNIKENLLPATEKYLAVNSKIRKVRLQANGISRLTKLMRKPYYKISNKVLTKDTKVIDCYAGIASAHVNFNGDLWACCVKAERMGNLLEQGFDEIWHGKKAREIRKKIKTENCYCTMANACYSNMLCNPSCFFFS